MATQIYELATHTNARGEECRFILEYDPVAMYATGFRVANASAQDSAYGEVARPADGLKFTNLALPGTDTRVIIPTLQATRIPVQRHPSGDLVGFAFRALFPYTP